MFCHGTTSLDERSRGSTTTSCRSTVAGMSTEGKVLVWNNGRYVRAFAVNGATYSFPRGLSLIDDVHWRAVRQETARCADIEELGTDVRLMDIEVLIQAIADTKERLEDPGSFQGFGPRPGAVALAWLAQQETPPAVTRALTLTP